MDHTVHLLNDICKNTEMGVDGIKIMQKRCKNRELSCALEQQLEEYGEIYSLASDQLARRGHSPKKIPAAAKIASHLSATAKGIGGMSASQIAESMIEGNTMGVIQITRQARRCKHCSREAADLAATLAETTQRNIDSMKRFL